MMQILLIIFLLTGCSLSAVQPTTESVPDETVSPPPGPIDCTMSVEGAGNTAQVYFQPTTESGLFGALSGGASASVVGQIDSWYAIDPAVAQAPNTGIYRLRWIETSAPVTLDGSDCNQLPYIELAYTTPTEECTLTPVDSVDIYHQHTFDIAPVDTLRSGETARVIGQTPTDFYGASAGWYAVESDNVELWEVARYRLRWILMDAEVTLSGACENLAIVTLDVF